EPILARPVGVLERALKWVKRRPALATLLGVSVAATVALAALGVWSNAELRRAAQHERQARQRAESRSRLARQAVDDMYTQVAEQWLANEPHKDELQRAFLQKALRIYEELAAEESTDPTIRRDTGLAYFRMARIYQELGQHGQAREA